LNKFVEAFHCPISKVSPQAIRDYLLNRDVSNRTKHNLRTTLTMLFNFAKTENYLPANHQGVSRPMKRSRIRLAIKYSRLMNWRSCLHGVYVNTVVSGDA
jgi:hypothetical protein